MISKPQQKQQLRNSIKKEIVKLSNRKLLDQKINVTVSNFLKKFDDHNVLIYDSLKDEPDINDVVNHFPNIKFFFACKNELGFYKKYLKQIQYDFSILNLVFVPGRLFCHSGNRIGRGGGWYDKILQNSKAIKVGVCYDIQVLKQIPQEDHDIKMDLIITESKIYNCRGVKI